MELSPKQQITKLIQEASLIYLLTHLNPDGDSLGSMLALGSILKKMGKEVLMACPDSAPAIFQFLPEISEVQTQLTPPEYVIKIDTTDFQIDKLSYRNLSWEKKLAIVLNAKQGSLRPENISLENSFRKPDLIFVLDSPDLERLGHLYESLPDLFYETPIVNIDHHPSNDYFGKVNWVDLTATSTAEMLVSLFESLSSGQSLIDPDVATDLLTGLTTDTGSFQNVNTTPKSLTVAAQLVAAGARQQDIIRFLYKTRPLSTLKLWGKILAKVKQEARFRFVWSTATQSDFNESGAKDEEASGVIDELLKTAPGIDFAILLVERGAGLHGSLRAVERGANVSQIASLFGGGGHEQAAAFDLAQSSLSESLEEILEKIRDYQRTKKEGVSTG